VQQIESLGHRPVLIDGSVEGLRQALRQPAQIVIADMAMPGLQPAAFCRALRQTAAGKESYALLLASPESEGHILEAIDAGADDVLVKPLTMQTLRVRLNTATRMLLLREEIQRERRGIMRSTGEFAVAHKRLLQEALTDTLTQLPNRRHGLDFLASEWAFSQSNALPMAFLLLDIDHFKRINDSHGHAAGDALLCELTRRLREALRIEDTLARMGGDELMVLLPDVGASATEAEAAAREVARKLRATLEVPVQVGALEYRVGASIGITVFPREDSPTVEDLIREADTAMYVAKQAERGSVRLYESTMREHVASRVALERALRLAIEQDQIRLHLQGQWTADGQMAGIEALARWQDPELGAVSPVDFIPVAEESGLILPLGRRVVEQACATARRLHDEGILVPLSVNVSPRQFTDPGFVAHLLQSVRDQGIAPSDLQLELTEGILADDASERLMNRLADEGFRFSIDDFGTGW
ncbi:MAG: diguanylate cyclase, partial [Candidatus Accumulibacter sp.]|nr:diguanylate cyclase [Accumulibacter sp.]